jgi:hypothetical protein
MDTKSSQKAVELKQKIYGQFVNRLCILLLTGAAGGGCVLALADYLLNAQIPERSPFVVGFFAVVSFAGFAYWLAVFSRAKGIEGLRGLALFAAIFACISSGIGVVNITINQRNLSTYFQGERIVIKDKKATAATLAEYINIWRHTPNYSLVYISEDVFYATVYNSSGESVTQLASAYEGEDLSLDEVITFCLNDGTSVIVDAESVSRRKDVDSLSYVMKALEWVTLGKADIERASVSETLLEKGMAPSDAFPGTEYGITISGLDNARAFFTELIGSEDASDMMSGLAGADVSLLYNVFLADSGIAVSSSISMDGEVNLMWYIDGNTEVYDWSLGGYDWYNYDYTDADQNELMIEEAMYNVTSMLDKFGADIGLDYDDGAVEADTPAADTPAADTPASSEDTSDD